MVALLLIVGATFFICDGLQTAAAGALRGLNDTRVPLAVRRLQLLADRLHGVVSAWRSRCGLGAVGVWIGFSCSLVVFAALLILRFRYLTGRGYLPEMVRAEA